MKEDYGLYIFGRRKAGVGCGGEVTMIIIVGGVVNISDEVLIRRLLIAPLSIKNVVFLILLYFYCDFIGFL